MHKSVTSFILLLLPFLLYSEPLRIITINVWSGLDYTGYLKMGEYETKSAREQRYLQLVDELRKLDPDVIALNEANKLPHYARRIARDLNYDCIYHLGLGGLHIGPVGLPVNIREGDVILARRELQLQYAGHKQISGGYVGNHLTFHFADATQVVAASIRIAGRRVFVLNTHWHASSPAGRDRLHTLADRYLARRLTAGDYLRELETTVRGHEWRLDEARRTIAFADAVAGDNPVILLGDFNALPASEQIGLLRSAGFVDTYALASPQSRGYTWDERLNRTIRRYYYPESVPDTRLRRERIDYIFIRGGNLEIKHSEVVFNNPESNLHPSDHFGVMTVLEIFPEP